MRITKRLSAFGECKYLNTIAKCELHLGLLWCEASSSDRLLGMYVKNNPCNALLYSLVGSAWLHMLIYSSNLQLSFRTLFVWCYLS